MPARLNDKTAKHRQILSANTEVTIVHLVTTIPLKADFISQITAYSTGRLIAKTVMPAA
jgi:hypothetical protein